MISGFLTFKQFFLSKSESPEYFRAL